MIEPLTRESLCHAPGVRLAGLAMRGVLQAVLCVAFLAPIHSPAQTGAQALALGLPIDCELGQNCHVLAYVDQLPGPAFQDAGGGRQTYDAHDGTDFGIANEAVMNQGVVVKAAAAGTVIRVRDGVSDKRVTTTDQAQAINPLGCGNGVVIDHPNGWRTSYCHMRQGSLRVKKGTPVEKGAALGLVGLSGLTSYPHLHFGLQHKGQQVDPFTGHSPSAPGNTVSQPLWEATTAYVAAGLINSGFATQRPDINTVWQGRAAVPSLPASAPAVVFWVHPFGVLAGDVEEFRLTDPNGQATQWRRTLAQSNRINALSSVTKIRTPDTPLRAGIWQGNYQLRRGDKLLIDIRREIEVTKS